MASNASSAGSGLLQGLLHSPQMSGAVILLVVASLMLYLLSRPKALNFPVLGKSGDIFHGDAMIEGSAKYPNTPFVIPAKPPMVILPLHILDEIRNLPEEKVSFNKAISQNFAAKHTGIWTDPPVLRAIKVDLTRNVAKTLVPLQDEVRYSFNAEIGQCDDWTTVKVYDAMARIIALLSGRVFVGLPLSRNEEWIDASIRYTMDCIGIARVIAKWPVFLRDIVAPFLPEIKGIKQYGARGGKLLEPLLKEILSRDLDEKGTDKDIEKGTFISWILQYLPPTELANAEHLARAQMNLTFAAIHTSTMTITHAIYDLVSRREYIQPLRDEIQQVIDEDGEDLDSEGYRILKKTSMAKLKKLDSFLKESQRTSPPGIIANSRITTAPLTLSTGHTLPYDTKFAFPLHAVNNSPERLTYSPAYNPAINKPPSEFDGFRFANLRAMPGKENRHQFVTTSSDSLNFGHGNHACPGRFFASNEIKVVLIELLRNWDFRLKGDVDLVGGVEKRPKNIEQEFAIMPNMWAELEFKRRKE